MGMGQMTDPRCMVHTAPIFRHRHRHHGGMPNKTPPRTESQISATITTLLSSILLFACLHQQPITEPNVVFVGQQKSLMRQFGQHKLLNKKWTIFHVTWTNFVWQHCRPIKLSDFYWLSDIGFSLKKLEVWLHHSCNTAVSFRYPK